MWSGPPSSFRGCQVPHLSVHSFFRNKTANGDCRKDPRERSRSPIERAVAPTMSLHGNHLYTSLPSLSMEQPLALTKNSMDASRPAGISPTLTPVERQQVRLCPVGSGWWLMVGPEGWVGSAETRPRGRGERGWVLGSLLGTRGGGDRSRVPFTKCRLAFRFPPDLPGPRRSALVALEQMLQGPVSSHGRAGSRRGVLAAVPPLSGST